MKKRETMKNANFALSCFFVLQILFVCKNSQAQLTIYSENFDGLSTGLIFESTPVGGWTASSNAGQLTDGCFVDAYTCGCGFTYCIRNVWTIYSGGTSSLSAISGRSMGVSGWDGNTLAGQFDYWVEASTTRWAKRNFSFSGYKDINLAFQWKAAGESSGTTAIDYGSVHLSTNGGTTFSTLTSGGNGNTGKYFGKTTTQAADIDLAATYDNLSSVLLAFKWTCDNNSAGGGPTFIVDNIVISGCPLAGSITPLTTTFTTSGSTTLSVSGVVTGASYQWQSAPASAGPWADIPGATTASYTTPTLTETTYYRCAVGAGSCTPSYQSSPAVVTINSTGCTPAEVSLSPVSQAACHSASLSFNCEATGTLPISYQWQYSTDGGTTWVNYSDGNGIIGSQSNLLQITSAGMAQNSLLVQCSVNNSCGNDISNTAILTILPSPVVFASDDTLIEPGSSANLSCFAQNGTPPYNYTWQPGSSLNDPQIQNPVANPTLTTNYTVFVEDANGCIGSDEITVNVNTQANLLIPNVMTPNGDGINDGFKIQAEGVTLVKVSIFSRWGKKIADFDALQTVWDGKTATGEKVDDGTYFYVIDATDLDGKKIQYQGSLSVFAN